MFNKKAVQKAIKAYKEEGLLPNIFLKDAQELMNITQVGFLLILKKVIDVELNTLKKQEEEKLGSGGLTTELLVVTWVNPSKSDKLTKEGMEYLKANHPKWLEEKLKKGYFTWKLR